MSLVELVLSVHSTLDDHSVRHAFGGALALGYIAEPRGTVDVDVNVFAPVADLDAVLAPFADLDLRPERSRDDWLPAAGIRLRSPTHPYPVDVFPSLDAERYADVERRVVQHPFGAVEELVPFLSAEDLTVFKLSFGRDKDWVDLRNIVESTSALDLDYIEQQLLALRGPHMHPRLARLRRMARRG